RSARPPPPGSPVGFSALMERVRASESTDRPPGPNGAGCVMRDPFDGVVSAGSGHAEVVLRGDVLLGDHLPPQIAQAALALTDIGDDDVRGQHGFGPLPGTGAQG